MTSRDDARRATGGRRTRQTESPGPPRERRVLEPPCLHGLVVRIWRRVPRLPSCLPAACTLARHVRMDQRRWRAVTDERAKVASQHKMPDWRVLKAGVFSGDAERSDIAVSGMAQPQRG